MTSDGSGGPMRQVFTRQAFTRQAFAERLDRLGPALARWPAEERAAAERLLADDGAARAMLEAAVTVAGALRMLMQAEPALAPARRRRGAASRPMAPSWRRLAGFGMAALAASLAIGFVVGAVLPAADDDDGTAAVYMAVNDTDLGGVL